jgi:hypothetical protein
LATAHLTPGAAQATARPGQTARQGLIHPESTLQIQATSLHGVLSMSREARRPPRNHAAIYSNSEDDFTTSSPLEPTNSAGNDLLFGEHHDIRVNFKSLAEDFETVCR